MIPIQAHHTAYHEKYPSKRLLLLMQRSIGRIQAFPFDCLKQHCDNIAIHCDSNNARKKIWHVGTLARRHVGT